MLSSIHPLGEPAERLADNRVNFVSPGLDFLHEHFSSDLERQTKQLLLGIMTELSVKVLELIACLVQCPPCDAEFGQFGLDLLLHFSPGLLLPKTRLLRSDRIDRRQRASE